MRKMFFDLAFTWTMLYKLKYLAKAIYPAINYPALSQILIFGKFVFLYLTRFRCNVARGLLGLVSL